MPFDMLPDRLADDLAKLRIARDGLAGSNGWQTSYLGIGEREAHCLVGWLLVATDWDESEATRLALDYIYPALPRKPARPVNDKIWRIMSFNDNHSQKAVVGVLDAALELAAAKR